MMQFSLKSSLYVLVIITSCGARTESGSLKHNVGEPVRHEAKPWMWAHDTEAEYLAMGNPTDETSLLGPKKFLPADHALTQRLQTWLNEIDANVRAKDPASAVMIPKPIIHVEITDDVNAFVTAIPVCFDNVSVRFNGSQNSGTRDSRNFIAIYDDGNFSGGAEEDGTTPQQSKDCRHSELTITQLQDRLDYLNDAYAACTLTAHDLGGGKLEVAANAGCLVTGAIENAAGAAIFAMMSTSNHVTIYTGIIKVMGESEIVSVLAHELGHYFRPHISQGSKNYNFAYDISAFNPSERPAEKSGTQKLRTDSNDARETYSTMSSRFSDLRSNVPSSVLKTIAGSAFHPMTTSVLFDLLQLYSTTEVQGCAAANAAGQRLISSHVFDNFSLQRSNHITLPLHQINAGQRNAELAWESMAKHCLDGIQITDTTLRPRAIDAMESATSANHAARTSAKPIPGSGTMLDWLMEMDSGVRHVYETKTFEPATELSAAKIAEIVANYKKSIQDSQAQASQFESQKLGLYTVEQEADELAAEWIRDLKFDVKTPGNVDMAFVKLFDSDNDYNDCNAKRATNWTNGADQAVFLAWNEVLLDPHPADCYRVRDQDLEIKAHGYQNPAEGPRAMPTSPAWSELTAGLPASQNHNASFGAHSIGSAHGVFRDAHPLHCRFDAHQ